MVKFIFILTIWYSDGAPPDVHVEHSGLSGDDCIALMINAYNNPVKNALPSCEIDYGTPPE